MSQDAFNGHSICVLSQYPLHRYSNLVDMRFAKIEFVSQLVPSWQLKCMDELDEDAEIVLFVKELCSEFNAICKWPLLLFGAYMLILL